MDNLKKILTQGLLKCKKCGYRWFPRVAEPQECPQCKSRKWNNDSRYKNKRNSKGIN